MKAFSKKEILERFDKDPDYEFGLIQFCHYTWNGKTKLKVFLSDTEWLIVFEQFNFSTRDYNFIIDTTIFTNSTIYDNILTSDVIDHLPDFPFFQETYNDEDFSLDYFDFEILIKGQKEHFKLSQDDYANAGINLEDKRVPKFVKILRVLAFLIPEKIFDSDEELLKKISKKESVFKYTNGELTARGAKRVIKDYSDFKLFLDIEEWQHIIRTWDVEEFPSESISYQSIAEAIANRDASLYHCPKENCNSHWSNWDEAIFEELGF